MLSRFYKVLVWNQNGEASLPSWATLWCGYVPIGFAILGFLSISFYYCGMRVNCYLTLLHGFLICGLFRKIKHLFSELIFFLIAYFGKYEQQQPSHSHHHKLMVFLHHPLKENVLDAEAAVRLLFGYILTKLFPTGHVFSIQVSATGQWMPSLSSVLPDCVLTRCTKWLLLSALVKNGWVLL